MRADGHQVHIAELVDLHAAGKHDVEPAAHLEIENFFQTYKALEDKWTDVVGWEDAAAAERVIRQARKLHTRGVEDAELP